MEDYKGQERNGFSPRELMSGVGKFLLSRRLLRFNANVADGATTNDGTVAVTKGVQGTKLVVWREGLSEEEMNKVTIVICGDESSGQMTGFTAESYWLEDRGAESSASKYSSFARPGIAQDMDLFEIWGHLRFAETQLAREVSATTQVSH